MDALNPNANRGWRHERGEASLSDVYRTVGTGRHSSRWRRAAAFAGPGYMRAVMALARLEATQGNKQKALDAVSVGDNLLPNYAPLKALRQSIESGEKPKQQVENAAQGAAAVLFSVGAALNRDGAEDIVSLYLQTANALDPDSPDTLVLLEIGRAHV